MNLQSNFLLFTIFLLAIVVLASIHTHYLRKREYYSAGVLVLKSEEFVQEPKLQAENLHHNISPI